MLKLLYKYKFQSLLHFDQNSDGRIVGFSTLPCRMYDTMIFFMRRLSDIFPIRRLSNRSVYRRLNVNRRLSDTYRSSLLQHGRRFYTYRRRLTDEV